MDRVEDGVEDVAAAGPVEEEQEDEEDDVLDDVMAAVVEVVVTVLDAGWLPPVLLLPATPDFFSVRPGSFSSALRFSRSTCD